MWNRVSFLNNNAVLIKRKKFFLLVCFLFLCYLYEILDANYTYCDNHFTVYVSQLLMLYSLNLYCDVCHCIKCCLYNSMSLFTELVLERQVIKTHWIKERIMQFITVLKKCIAVFKAIFSDLNDHMS